MVAERIPYSVDLHSARETLDKAWPDEWGEREASLSWTLGESLTKGVGACYPVPGPELPEGAQAFLVWTVHETGRLGAPGNAEARPVGVFASDAGARELADLLSGGVLSGSTAFPFRTSDGQAFFSDWTVFDEAIRNLVCVRISPLTVGKD